MGKILSIIAIVLGLALGLKYLGVYDTSSFIPGDVGLVASIFLVGQQLFYLLRIHLEQGTTGMGKIIKLLIMLPGLIFLAGYFFGFSIGFDVSFVVALLLFVEGIYGLH
ncbi:MAG: hypothetical protein QS98_C0008G0046 [archaeon GW2011_AR3]|nr:MAG: hypothetical protein QS98_C0008G0046 [archaeon GW2011_AR3]